MFSFLLEGKLGEFLAPNSQSPLHSAIQRNDQEAIQNMLATASTIDICRIDECGYSAVHVACRYNNLFALQLIFSRGVHCEQPDKNGSTPLHYASKYGHLDLCKHLVERGAYAAKKNNFNQTPYDLAESHLIRQYLLPLQFNAERETQMQHPSGGLDMSMGISYGGGMQQQQAQNISGNTMPYMQQEQANYGIPMQMQQQYQQQQQQQAPPSQMMYPNQQMQSVPMNSGYQQQQQPQQQPPQQSSYQQPSIVPTLSNASAIRPDGFGSSASDPALQAKYGHIKEVVNIAPPPILSQNSPIQYSAFQGTSATAYNRYVPYDVNSPPAPMQQQAQYPSQQQQLQQQQPVQQYSQAPPMSSYVPLSRSASASMSVYPPVPADQLSSLSAPPLQPAVNPLPSGAPVVVNTQGFSLNHSIVQTKLPSPSSRRPSLTPQLSTVSLSRGTSNNSTSGHLVSVDLNSPPPLSGGVILSTSSGRNSFDGAELDTIDIISSNSSSIL